MSFSLKVKNEVCRYSDIDEEEAIAELSAIMKVSGTLMLGSNRQFSFKIITENAAIARFIFKILKDIFHIHARILVKRSNSLKKNNVYVIMIMEDADVRFILKKVGLLKEEEDIFSLDYSIPKNIRENEKLKKAYIRGAFLGGGSISNPEKTYHLEFVTNNEKHAKDLSNIINSFGMFFIISYKF